VIWAAAGAIALVLSAPHLLRRGELSPSAGIALWLAALVLRGVVAVISIAFLVLGFPATELFQLLTHWCFHTVIPLLTAHLGLSGHEVADTAILLPAVFIATSAVGAGFGLWRGARAVARWVRASALGVGPRDSIVVEDSQVFLTAAGLRSPEIVVSTGAIAALDEAELAAGLEHERGHIARRHQVAYALGHVLSATARLIPGTRSALANLSFHLERDADLYAVARTDDPIALASAIGKGRTRNAAASCGASGSALGRPYIGADAAPARRITG
jgi:Zn-dependent protease with chaperone function